MIKAKTGLPKPRSFVILQRMIDGIDRLVWSAILKFENDSTRWRIGAPKLRSGHNVRCSTSPSRNRCLPGREH